MRTANEIRIMYVDKYADVAFLILPKVEADKIFNHPPKGNLIFHSWDRGLLPIFYDTSDRTYIEKGWVSYQDLLIKKSDIILQLLLPNNDDVIEISAD